MNALEKTAGQVFRILRRFCVIVQTAYSCPVLSDGWSSSRHPLVNSLVRTKCICTLVIPGVIMDIGVYLYSINNSCRYCPENISKHLQPETAASIYPSAIRHYRILLVSYKRSDLNLAEKYYQIPLTSLIGQYSEDSSPHSDRSCSRRLFVRSFSPFLSFLFSLDWAFIITTFLSIFFSFTFIFSTSRFAESMC